MKYRDDFDWGDITDVDLAYLAGIIDGEGTIGLYRCKNKKTRTGYYYSSTVQVSSCNYILMEWLGKKFGYVGWSGKKRPERGKKVYYTFRFSRKFCEELLPLLVEFLIIKKRQAKLLIGSFPFLRSGNWKIETLKERHEKLEEISREIKRCNEMN